MILGISILWGKSISPSTFEWFGGSQWTSVAVALWGAGVRLCHLLRLALFNSCSEMALSVTALLFRVLHSGGRRSLAYASWPAVPARLSRRRTSLFRRLPGFQSLERLIRRRVLVLEQQVDGERMWEIVAEVGLFDGNFNQLYKPKPGTPSGTQQAIVNSSSGSRLRTSIRWTSKLIQRIDAWCARSVPVTCWVSGCIVHLGLVRDGDSLDANISVASGTCPEQFWVGVGMKPMQRCRIRSGLKCASADPPLVGGLGRAVARCGSRCAIVCGDIRMSAAIGLRPGRLA